MAWAVGRLALKGLELFQPTSDIISMLVGLGDKIGFDNDHVGREKFVKVITPLSLPSSLPSSLSFPLLFPFILPFFFFFLFLMPLFYPDVIGQVQAGMARILCHCGEFEVQIQASNERQCR